MNVFGSKKQSDSRPAVKIVSGGIEFEYSGGAYSVRHRMTPDDQDGREAKLRDLRLTRDRAIDDAEAVKSHAVAKAIADYEAAVLALFGVASSLPVPSEVVELTKVAS